MIEQKNELSTGDSSFGYFDLRALSFRKCLAQGYGRQRLIAMLAIGWAVTNRLRSNRS